MKQIIYLISTLLIYTGQLKADIPFEDFLSSTPEQLITLTESQDFLIGNVIHPLSGQIHLRQTDLIARGAENIELQRVFIPDYTPLNEKDGKTHASKESYGGWVQFPHTHLSIFTTKTESSNKTNKNTLICASDPNGVVLVYELIDGKTRLKSQTLGICNGADGFKDKNTPFFSFPEWANKRYFYDSLTDCEDKEIEIFAKYRKLMDEEFPDNNILERAQIGDDAWLMCPNCIDAWEEPSQIKPMVICPMCKKMMHNPRYIDELPHY